MNRMKFALGAIALFTTSLLGAQSAPVPSAMTTELQKIFPEIASGYVDLNGSGKMENSEDLTETITESRVKDGQLQVQEILDFIIANWRFIPLAKLQALQKVVKGGTGALGELIAIDFGTVLGETVKNREAMGDGLFLTPSAYKKAMEMMSDILSTMALSYKKEGAKSESDFVAARDKLFAQIEKGYPLPDSIPLEEKSTLATSLIGTVLKEKQSNPARTKLALKTLAQLKAQEASIYLTELVDVPEYKIEALKAMGDIGIKTALPVMVRELKTSTVPEVKKAALQAIGKVGGAESLDTILELSKVPSRNSLTPDLLETLVQALGGVAQSGNTDFRIQAALKEFAQSDNPGIRKAALTGVGSFSNPQAVEQLIASLNTDRDTAVRISAVKALAKQRGDSIVPTFMKVLREKDLDPGLKTAILTVLGDYGSAATAALPAMVEFLADPAVAVRTTAASGLKKLYPGNSVAVSGALTRSVAISKDDNLLIEATALLADLADPTTLLTLQNLLQKPIPEVKRNVTWALYRIKSTPNPKIVEELQKLITSESESVTIRINAVRAVGAIGFDSPQLNVNQSLVTAARMRGDKYAMLRIFAVRSLGQLGNSSDSVITALGRLATRDPDLELRKEAVLALQKIASANPEVLDTLASSVRSAEDLELKVRTLESLADMGSPRVAELASELLGDATPEGMKRRILFAVSRSGDEEGAKVLFESLKDPKNQDFVLALLEGFPSALMKVQVSRRLKTEGDKSIIPALEALDLKFSGDK